MPSILINEIDRTQYNVISNDSDNVVYVPGSAITGPSDAPVLCRDYNTFIATFGKVAPETNDNIGTGWHYAANILLAGFPVLFQRITEYMDSSNVKQTISQTAKYTMSHDDNGTTVVDMIVSYRYAGTYGNETSIKFNTTWTTGGGTDAPAYLEVYRGTITDTSKPIETILLATIPASAATDADVALVLAPALATVSTKSSYVDINVTEATFTLPSGWNSSTTSYSLAGGTDASEDDVATALTEDDSFYNMLTDKDLFDVKFVTTGGLYAGSCNELYTGLLRVAYTRGDSLAILDAPMSFSGEKATADDVQNFFMTLPITDRSKASYGTACYPWELCPLAVGGNKWMAPSYVFLSAIAASVGTGNPVWLPPAGVNRGSISTIATEASMVVGSAVSDQWQDNAPYINPFRIVRNYGQCLFGQRTLYYTGSSSVKSAFEDLNVRLTANEIKKAIDNISIALTFEGNNSRTWLEFVSQLDPILMQIKVDGGIERYEIIMDESTISDDDINNRMIRGVVRVQITRAVEDFAIDFVVTNNSADFSESVVS